MCHLYVGSIKAVTAGEKLARGFKAAIRGGYAKVAADTKRERLMDQSKSKLRQQTIFNVAASEDDRDSDFIDSEKDSKKKKKKKVKPKTKKKLKISDVADQTRIQSFFAPVQNEGGHHTPTKKRKIKTKSSIDEDDSTSSKSSDSDDSSKEQQRAVDRRAALALIKNRLKLHSGKTSNNSSSDDEDSSSASESGKQDLSYSEYFSHERRTKTTSSNNGSSSSSKHQTKHQIEAKATAERKAQLASIKSRSRTTIDADSGTSTSDSDSDAGLLGKQRQVPKKKRPTIQSHKKPLPTSSVTKKTKAKRETISSGVRDLLFGGSTAVSSNHVSPTRSNNTSYDSPTDKEGPEAIVIPDSPPPRNEEAWITKLKKTSDQLMNKGRSKTTSSSTRYNGKKVRKFSPLATGGIGAYLNPPKAMESKDENSAQPVLYGHAKSSGYTGRLPKSQTCSGDENENIPPPTLKTKIWTIPKKPPTPSPSLTNKTLGNPKESRFTSPSWKNMTSESKTRRQSHEYLDKAIGRDKLSFSQNRDVVLGTRLGTWKN